MTKLNIIFFDFETTGFDRPIRPVQIGAVDSWSENSFEQYLMPFRKIHPKATETHGISSNQKGTRLFKENIELDCIPMEDGLQDFIDWLESLGGNAVLVAHKCFDYDAKVLIWNLEYCQIEYRHVIRGFGDSLLASRSLYPNSPSHKLSNMLIEVGLPCREEHDAMEDAVDCRKIFRRMAAQNGYKFIRFLFNDGWYKTLEQQINWTYRTREQQY